MNLPKHALDSMAHKLAIQGGMPRDEAQLIMDTAHHAASEAMETMARICLSLDNTTHMLTAMSMATLIMEAASKVEREGVRDLARELIRRHDARG